MNKAVFLDRDGTINIDTGYLHRIEDFEYLPGAIEGLRKLQEMGYLLIVVTNQSGIARGLFTEDDYHKIDDWMKSDLKLKGIDIEASYFCPHHPDAQVERYRCNCNCRKPGTELFWRAQKEFDIDMERSFAIGDKERDLSICKEAAIKGILLTSDKMNNSEYRCCSAWNEIIDVVEQLQG